jgi:hypothetical protein
MRILILWPSGEVQTSSSQPIVVRKILSSFTEDMNRGDLFVHESTLRTLSYDYAEEVVPFLDNITDELYKYYNDNFDYLVIRGSNYIRNDGNLGEWLSFFQRIEIPILAFGIGAQAPSSNETVELNKNVIDSLLEISKKSVHSIGVRGEYTKKLLNQFGIDNVTAIGCPSIFRERTPDLKINYLGEDSKNIAFTTHPYLAGLYTRNIWNSRVFQVRLIEKFRNSGYKLKYLTQGISAETKIAYNIERDAGVDELKEIGWFNEDYAFIKDFIDNSICFESANDYYNFSSNSDLNIGTRLHGNITALAMGKPAIFVTYDTRTAELADHFCIPTLSEDEISEDFDVRKFLKKVSFEPFNEKYSDRYKIFSNFLDDNKLAHRMN